MPSFCGEFSGGRIDLVTGEVRAGAIWCKSWLCEHCAPIRKKQLQAQACNGNPTKFITLTSKYRPSDMTPDQAAQELVHAWRMVVQRGKRDKLFSEIQYIAVFELTKQGWPHLHILARCSFLSQKWLSERMAEYADSPIVDVRKIKTRNAVAWYVSKYIAKEPQRFKHCKRYWRTHKYDLQPQKPDKPVHDRYKGYWSTWHIQEVAGVYQGHDYSIEWDSDHSFTAIPKAINIHLPRMQEYNASQAPPYRDRR